MQQSLEPQSRHLTVMLHAQVEPVFGQPGATDFLATTLCDPLGETGARLSSQRVRLVKGASVLVPITPRNVHKHRSGDLQVTSRAIARVDMYHLSYYCEAYAYASRG